MGEFRFLHAADIHLDSPICGLEADPDRPLPLLREASRAAFRNLVRTAIEEQVAFVVIAGDLYDGEWQDWRTGHFFTGQVAQLADAGIPVVIVAGNHDAQSVVTRHLRLPQKVTLLPPDRCGRVVLDEHGVAIHGQSFATRAVTEDLSRHYPEPLPGLFNIGLLHTSLNGRPGHDTYAPTSAAALAAKGYDYWALGHVHRREIVAAAPWIVFPGNLQGRHSRECGAKGASLVCVRDGRVAAVEHRPLDVLRWCRIEIGLAGAPDLDAAMAEIGQGLATEVAAAGGRPLAARVRLTGETPLHAALCARREQVREGIIAEGRQIGDDRVWIEEVAIGTRAPARRRDPAGRPDIAGRLAAAIDAVIAADGAGLLGEYPERLRQRLPPDGIGDPVAADLLASARSLVLARLAAEA